MEGVIWLGIFTLALLLLDVYCIYKVVDYFRMKKNGVCCYAKITKLEKEIDRTHISYRPWIEYTTNDNVTITSRFESAMSIKSKKFSVGKSVKIYYDKEKPNKYIIDKNSLYVQLALVFLVTIFLICIGMLFGKLLVDTINYQTL